VQVEHRQKNDRLNPIRITGGLQSIGFLGETDAG